MKEPALLAYKEDIKKRSLLDWLKAHTSFVKPLHRYEGNIELNDNKLIFKGHDKIDNKKFNLEIFKNEIVDLKLGFDETFTLNEDRSKGITFKPLKIVFNKDGKEYTVYLIINFKRLTRTTNNKLWYESINSWLNDK